LYSECCNFYKKKMQLDNIKTDLPEIFSVYVPDSQDTLSTNNNKLSLPILEQATTSLFYSRHNTHLN